MRTSVLRAVMRPDDLDGLEQLGCLTIELGDDEDQTEPVVWYTLGRGHLLELLAAARSSATNSDLLLSLDAAALDDHE